MNQNTQFEKKVLKPAIKEIRKYYRKHGELPEESVIRELYIQIVSPFIRILSFTFGFFLVVIGSFAIINQSFIIGGISSLSGLILCILGLRGKKKKLEDEIEKSDTTRDIALIIEAISYIDW